jgi:hypothetical protein
MSNFITLPDGNAISPAVIKSVFYFQGKGVMCRDAQQRPLSYIKVADDDLGHRVRDLLIKAVNDGARALQPDWSFLDEESAA